MNYAYAKAIGNTATEIAENVRLHIVTELQKLFRLPRIIQNSYKRR